ncbi:hypothetical protein Acr_00g0055240 [Actinidia rufa]|uniref:Uncharacterized protein n=1 Tax=Actinidia rufa TaxID=165716 RepID=A0A7J0DLV6_9ERIC|nr:hypothetical protein Acr_00g0055240 [Actinidia rufa]
MIGGTQCRTGRVVTILIRAFVTVVDFNELCRNRFEECKVAIYAIKNKRGSRKVADLLDYKPVYCHVIPHKVDKLGRIRLLALRIECQAPRRNNFSSKDFSAEFDENGLLTQDLG